MLERTKIRRKIIELLKGRTSAGLKIYDSKLTPWDIDELPAVSVVTPVETCTSKSLTSFLYDTELAVNIEAVCAPSEDWSDVLDRLCSEIIETLMQTPYFFDECEIMPDITTTMDFNSGGEHPVASAVISFSVHFNKTYCPKHETRYLGVEIREPSDGISALFEFEGD